ALGFSSLATHFSRTAGGIAAKLRLASVAFAACIALFAWHALVEARTTLGHALGQVEYNPLVELYDIATNKPQEVYFPWYPLPSLLADGSLYHFEFAVAELETV